MVEYAQKAGYELGGNAIHLTSLMVDSADLIICMDNFQVVEVQKRLSYVRWNRICLFNEICFEDRSGLPDPSGDTGYMYSYVLEHVLKGCDNLIEKLSKMIDDEGDTLW